MAKTTMVAKIYNRGTWRVIYEEGKENPFAVKFHGWNPFTGKDQTRTVTRYADLRSCLHFIADRIGGR